MLRNVAERCIEHYLLKVLLHWVVGMASTERYYRELSTGG